MSYASRRTPSNHRISTQLPVALSVRQIVRCICRLIALNSTLLETCIQQLLSHNCLSPRRRISLSFSFFILRRTINWIVLLSYKFEKLINLLKKIILILIWFLYFVSNRALFQIIYLQLAKDLYLSFGLKIQLLFLQFFLWFLPDRRNSWASTVYHLA